MGRKSSESLGLVKRAAAANEQQFFEKHSGCFKGLGCLLHVVNIELIDDAVLVIEYCRKVPFALYDKLKEDLETMENLGVSRNVEKPTD